MRMARRRQPSTHDILLTVAPGLESIALGELVRRAGAFARHVMSSSPGEVVASYHGPLRALLGLRTVEASFLASGFDVPRPKALLGHAHLTRLVGVVEQARGVIGAQHYKTLRLAAAGEDSSVMQRLRAELAAATGLHPADEGDMLVRLRPHPKGTGWQALVRLSPRPQSVRGWRVANYPGALDGAVAHAMVEMTQPQPADVVFNPMCGSGTLLIERAESGLAARLIGCDNSEAAKLAAHENVDSARFGDIIELHVWDATDPPLPDASVDVVLADLPFGHLVGSHAENVVLYPRVLAACARVAQDGARCVMITHEVRLMERELAASPHWRLEASWRVGLGGLHPRILVLSRRPR